MQLSKELRASSKLLQKWLPLSEEEQGARKRGGNVTSLNVLIVSI